MKKNNQAIGIVVLTVLFTLSACQTELAATKGFTPPLASTNNITIRPTRKPSPSPQPTPKPTETVFVQYDAPLDKTKLLSIKSRSNFAPTISSYSTENYNPVVFVVPGNGYNGIEFLGGVYKGEGVSIYDFLIDEKDMDSELIKIDEADNFEELFDEFQKQPHKQALIPNRVDFKFYTFNGKMENKNICVEPPQIGFSFANYFYIWYGDVGLYSDYNRLKVGILSSATHNPFPRKATYLNPASAEENDGKCCDYSIDLNGDNKPEKVIFTLQRESELYTQNQFHGKPVTCAILMTDQGNYILAQGRCDYYSSEKEFADYADMDVVPMDVDGDGKMELIVYCGYYGGGYVSMFQLREDGLHQVAFCNLGPYD